MQASFLKATLILRINKSYLFNLDAEKLVGIIVLN